ncbi:MAG: tetratricopeptide repeat protein [Sulfuricurvum sp.]|nr:tetratricopeptide repeat protein [Sulfuricurvum sp.]
MRLIVVISLVSSLVLASEPSVFGAGNLNSPDPYGLTSEEKLILDNKKEIQSVVQKNNLQSAKVETVTERLDGLQAVVEGLGQTVNEHKTVLAKIAESSASDGKLALTMEELQKQSTANTENITQLKTLIEELSHVVDSVNASYVTKEDFSQLVKQLKMKLPVKIESSVKMDPVTIEKKAKELFDQQKYAEAQTYYETLIQKKVKVSESNFWIGESYFKRKEYKSAIAYYKESSSLNDKAAHMPTLLLHTGNSMEENGDLTNAKAFYKATVSKYSGSGAANEAQDRLSKLK